MLSYNLSQLDRITKKIASKIKSNDYIMLYGELGSGKTTFARSFINGLQKKNKVKETNVLSPTFNLLYEYDVKSWKIMHFDLYRLQNIKEIDELNILEGSKNKISIIEWPEKIPNMPDNRIEINFIFSSKDNFRKLDFKGYGRWNNFNIDAI